MVKDLISRFNFSPGRGAAGLMCLSRGRIEQRKSFFLLLLVSCCLWSATLAGAAAEPRARLDRSAINIDETVNLRVEIDGALQSLADLDLSPLEKDFRILRQSSGSNIQIINGSTSAVKSWDLELEARHVGRLVIPPLSVGGGMTPALTLTVSEARAAAGGHSEIVLEVDPEIENPPYVQSQLNLRVRLKISEQLRLSEATLDEPEVKQARVIKLGDDRSYRQQATAGGSGYQVIERHYALIPETDGELTIPPLTFQGLVLSGGSPFTGDPFFGRLQNRGRRLRARSQELKITVLPPPNSFPGRTWLPARQLAIMEKDSGPATIKVGEPLTRVIQVEALGLSAEQLPELDFAAPEGLRLYPDQAELETGIDNLSLHGVSKRSLAVIAGRPGRFILPEITIDWWDLANNRSARAVLPARSLEVVAAAANHAAAPPAAVPTATDTGPAAENRDQNHTTAAPPKAATLPAPGRAAINYWQLLALFFALLWLGTIGAWWRAQRQPRPITVAPAKKPDLNPAAAREELRRACAAHDPRAAHQALLVWGRSLYPETPPRGLRELLLRLPQKENSELEQELRKLEGACFSPAAGEGWDGGRLAAVLARELKPVAAGGSKQKAELPPLYPPA